MNRRVCASLCIALSFAVARPALAKDPRILVVKQEPAELTIINAKTLEPLGSVGTGGKPHEVVVAPDGKLAYVSNYGGHDNSISVIDIDRMKELERIELAPHYRPHGMVMTADGKQLFATTESSRSVIELDVASRVVSRSWKTVQHKTHMIAMTPDEKLLFTTNVVSRNVTVIDLVKGETQRHILSGLGCEGLDVSPDGQALWVSNAPENSISIIDLQTMKRVEKIGCQGSPVRLKFTPDGTRVLASCVAADIIAIIDVKERKTIDRVRLGGGPSTLLIEPGGKRAFVSARREKQLHVIRLPDCDSDGMVQFQDTPDGLAYVPGK